MRGAIVIDNDRDPHQSLGGDDHLQFPFGSPGTLGHFPGEQSTDTVIQNLDHVVKEHL